MTMHPVRMVARATPTTVATLARTAIRRLNVDMDNLLMVDGSDGGDLRARGSCSVRASAKSYPE
jgi:hypothetical protein